MMNLTNVPDYLFVLILSHCQDFYDFIIVFSEWKEGKSHEQHAQILEQVDILRFFSHNLWMDVYAIFIRYATSLGNRDAHFYGLLQSLLTGWHVDVSITTLQALANEGHNISAFSHNIFTIMYSRDVRENAIDKVADLIHGRFSEPYLREWVRLLNMVNGGMYRGTRRNFGHVLVICPQRVKNEQGHFYPAGWPCGYEDVPRFQCRRCRVVVLLYAVCEHRW